MRVTGVYLLMAYGVVQGAATVFPLLNFPQSAATAVLIVAILGLPVVILLAWVFDITPEGVKRTADLPAEAPVLTAEQQIELHRRRFAARAVGFVGVGVIVALVGFAAYSRATTGPRAAAGSIESIAVLPFVDLSPNRDQEYFTDGVTEELLNGLSQIEGLRVAARTSSFSFKGQNVAISEIGRRLDVEAVIEGSVRRDGENVRVTARLVDVRSGAPLWSNQYDRKVSTVLGIQDEISAEIVDALKLRLAQRPELGAGSRASRDPGAQDLYYRGLKALNERTDEQLRAALQFFEQAVQLDTTYVEAYAGLAQTYAVLPAFSGYPVLDALRKGSTAAARALALDPNHGSAHAALGQIAQNLEWDLNSALRAYRRAVRANPNDATAHQWYAEALMLTGDHATAATEVERALEIDRLSPSARNVRAYLTLVRGDLPAALRHYQNLVRETPTFRLGQLNYALAAFAAEEWGVATEALIAALPEHAPNTGVIIAAASGQIDRALAVDAIRAIEATSPSSVIALLYAAVGARQVALEKLQKAFASGNDANFPYVLIHPLLQPLRSEPRFQQIARTVGVSLT